MAERLTTSGFVELRVNDLTQPQGLTELNRMLRTIFDNLASDTQNVRIYRGYATPESNVAADIGSLYLRLDGGSSTTLYVKESGTGATGWAAK